MPHKPMKRRKYVKKIAAFGWSIEKAGIDWKLVDSKCKPKVLCIIISHPGDEVSANSVHKTIQALIAHKLIKTAEEF